MLSHHKRDERETGTLSEIKQPHFYLRKTNFIHVVQKKLCTQLKTFIQNTKHVPLLLGHGTLLTVLHFRDVVFDLDSGFIETILNVNSRGSLIEDVFRIGIGFNSQVNR